MTLAPSFTDWLADKLGLRNWVVAARLTPRLRDRGYAVAISQRKFRRLMAEYVKQYGLDDLT